ncbi:unnamed protein product [Larinioides sclopetarius]|uniref:Uncharacterized protein n=1 Tax=Larinioides sclopetarius TaxID=280406 RepID=A0AAV2BFX9_9ARAC
MESWEGSEACREARSKMAACHMIINDWNLKAMEELQFEVLEAIDNGGSQTSASKLRKYSAKLANFIPTEARICNLNVKNFEGQDMQSECGEL